MKRNKKLVVIITTITVVIVLSMVGIVLQSKSEYEMQKSQDRATITQLFTTYLTYLKSHKPNVAFTYFSGHASLQVRSELSSWNKTYDPILCSENIPVSLTVSQISEYRISHGVYRRQFSVEEMYGKGTTATGTDVTFDETTMAVVAIGCRLQIST